MEFVALKDGVHAATYNNFTNLEIEGDFKVIIDYNAGYLAKTDICNTNSNF